MAFKMNGWSAFTTDYKQQYQNLVNQISDLKNKYASSDEADKTNIQKQVQIIQNKIIDLQRKMEKHAQQNPGGESKAYPVIQATASKKLQIKK